jgi:hypothetical protein
MYSYLGLLLIPESAIYPGCLVLVASGTKRLEVVPIETQWIVNPLERGDVVNLHACRDYADV